MICARFGCSAEAIATPVLRVWASRAHHGSHPPIELKIALPHCEEHKAAATVADMLTDEGWAELVRDVRSLGRAAPDRTTAELGWEALPS